MPNLLKSIKLTQDDKNTLEGILYQSTIEKEPIQSENTTLEIRK